MADRIILVLNYASDGQESMIRFGEVLHELLMRQGAGVAAWQPPRVFGRLSSLLPKKLSKWLAYADKFGLGVLSLLCMRLRYPGALWHVMDHGNAIYVLFLPPCRTLITCHDCIAIEDALVGRTGQKVGKFGPLFQRLISYGLRRAGMVVCVSRATADDLTRLVRPEPARVRMVHNGLVQTLEPTGKEQANSLLRAAGIDTERPFLFMIGSDQLRKNRLNTIRCFNALRADNRVPAFCLVMAGKPMQDDNRAAANASPWRHDIVEIGRISTPTLAAAYQQASVVLYPSLAEGFGLPIIEAQRCAAALVTSNLPPMSDIAGTGAVLVNPLQPEDMAAGVLKAIAEGDALRQRGVLNAARFTPENMLNGYLQAYKSMGYLA